MKRREPDEDNSALWFTLALLGLTAVVGVVAWYAVDGVAGMLDGLRGMLPW